MHEPLCRNVLIRRSNPTNRWILSTNSDIVPVYREPGTPLSSLLPGLDPELLHIAPRAEIPEQLWEGVDRRDPDSVHRLFHHWGGALGLNERVDCGPVVLHDGPGDFQLLGRDELFAIDGFDESILQGWHVDGNLCARMKARRGHNASLAGDVVAYHCDHNRQATPTHRSGFSSESAHDLVHGVRESELPGQRASWGAPGESFEEIRIVSDSGHRFGDLLVELRGDIQALQRISRLSRDSFNTSLAIPAAITFPHLASHLSTLPPGSTIAYFGRDPSMIRLLGDFLRHVGSALLASPDPSSDGNDDFWLSWTSASVVVFDAWAGDIAGDRQEWPRDLRRERSPIGTWARTQDRALRRLHDAALARGASPGFLFVGTQNTWLDIDLNRHFDLALTPFASHVRPGIARPAEAAWKEGLRSWWMRRKRRS